jgi:hypothetical protein
MSKIIDKLTGGASSTYRLNRANGGVTQSRENQGVYLVLGDTTDDPHIDILDNTPGLPLLGSYIPEGGVTVTRVSCDEEEVVVHPDTGQLVMLYKCTIGYDNNKADENGGGGGEGGGNLGDPLNLGNRESWSSEEMTIPWSQDIYGKAIANANGERIPAQRQLDVTVLKVTRYEPWPWNGNLFAPYRNTVNAVRFRSAAPYTVKLGPPEVTEEVIGGVKVNQVTYTFKYIDPAEIGTSLPWDQIFLHEGSIIRQDLPGPGGETFVKSVDPETGVPIVVNLSFDGYQLPNNAEPQFISFTQYRAANWGPLGLE